MQNVKFVYGTLYLKIVSIVLVCVSEPFFEFEKFETAKQTNTKEFFDPPLRKSLQIYLLFIHNTVHHWVYYGMRHGAPVKRQIYMLNIR